MTHIIQTQKIRRVISKFNLSHGFPLKMSTALSLHSNFSLSTLRHKVTTKQCLHCHILYKFQHYWPHSRQESAITKFKFHFPNSFSTNYLLNCRSSLKEPSSASLRSIPPNKNLKLKGSFLMLTKPP